MVTKDDFNTHLYAEIIANIDRADEDLLTTAIEVAETTVKGRLGRYNISALFGATGESRNAYLMNLIKDIAVWKFAALANPNIDLEFWKDKYEEAIREINGIQRGTVSPYDFPLAAEPTNIGDKFTVQSPTRRETRY